MNEIKEYTEKIFEDIKHIDELGNEYWLARELQSILGYNQWRSINDLIVRAISACKESKYNIDDHFALYRKMVDIGSKTTRKIIDYKLSRYACYLIVMNGNPKKEIIALGQTYFAIQTRKGNYNLNKTAVNSGVKDLARFHNAGYKGLYNGETADDIFKRKKLRYREDILDNMGSEELANNIFRIAQTDAKLERDNVDNEYTANSVHYEVGREVRKSIQRLGGTMPEDLPTPGKSIKEIKKNQKNLEIK